MTSTTGDLALIDRIALAIVSTELPPGSHVTAAGLAERFGVSRTPVRECLRGLEALGLVELHGNRGAFVVDPASIGAVAMRDLVDTRRLLEPTALRQAAERATTDDHARIARALDDGDAAMEVGDVGRLNVAHHQLLERLVAASHNEAAIDALRPLHFRTCLVVARTAAITLPHGWVTHRHVAELLAADEGEAAAQLHEQHLDEVLDSLA
ncbi:MAG: GntR family transcriptional regulator [Actinomycetota bacterium]